MHILSKREVFIVPWGSRRSANDLPKLMDAATRVLGVCAGREVVVPEHKVLQARRVHQSRNGTHLKHSNSNKVEMTGNILITL